jgi:alkanesulfonate monooxygenase SsuD/methylene tetrahydromethanopterin reductase-like flavin-dependent oxidoreductase (luciferase family)
MQFGAHLPLIAFGDDTWTLRGLSDYARAARELGFTHLTANDHFVFPRPWLDGPTALAATLHESAGMQLMTTVMIAAPRGYVQTAKTLAAIDVLSGGKLAAGIGPGSSARDYEAAGIPFEDRWKRLDDIVPALRAAWSGTDYAGKHYRSENLRPLPIRNSIPIWIGSWGSDAGLKRVARLADGWLASGYNATPALFADAKSRLEAHLSADGRAALPNAIATMFMYITESSAEADRVVREVVGRAIKRPVEELADRLLIGPAERSSEKLRAYREAGAETVFLWPVAEEAKQLERFRADVAPLVR